MGEAPLPGPREIREFDDTLTDLQLFKKYCVPLGDLWPEAGDDSKKRTKLDSTTAPLNCASGVITPNV